MSYRASSIDPVYGDGPGRGLPRVNYYLPTVVTLLAAVVLALAAGGASLIALLTAVTELEKVSNNEVGASQSTLGLCGLVGIGGLLATVYFAIAAVKGVRDLFTPLYFTRGAMADKRVIGGRRAGSWLAVLPRYAGPDLALASQLTAKQRAPEPDRSEAAREPDKATRKTSGYLSADRISTEEAAALDVKSHRALFRVDPAAHAALQPGDEVLVAHSRFLEHIFYVAHVKNGEWEAFRNKALI